jgi:hypothetical protein
MTTQTDNTKRAPQVNKALAKHLQAYGEQTTETVKLGAAIAADVEAIAKAWGNAKRKAAEEVALTMQATHMGWLKANPLPDDATKEQKAEWRKMLKNQIHNPKRAADQALRRVVGYTLTGDKNKPGEYGLEVYKAAETATPLERALAAIAKCPDNLEACKQMLDALRTKYGVTIDVTL